MGSNFQAIFAVFGVIALCVFIPLAAIFVGVPLLKGIGAGIGASFRGLGWLIRHVAEFVIGMLGDAIRLVGSIIAAIVLLPLMVLGVLFGRWSRASHFAGGVAREAKVFGGCLYRIAVRRPLKLVLLHGVLEGIEQRVPEAMLAAPGPDAPSRRTGQFEGYRIVGSLRPGGSGAKLYVAEPEDAVQARHPGMPDVVVIKSFAITDGSSLPQIVRESRALECAKQMGLIVDHGLDENRFFYVMPYHAGENLGVVTRQLHGESTGQGLEGRGLRAGIGYVADLVSTLATYHTGGLWHKDVKPDNVIVHNGAAHLVDLGLVTPLRSAMTLTTHGTEYFRDPEMVRQALRGVKVHEVDGVRFDVYAAGAVLYFLLENTFPAHGALSAFAKRSPESLRWIVRRAMAEYAKRYERADQMLADLRHVLAAADPFAVRPADLPSMCGERRGEVRGEVMAAAHQAAGSSAFGAAMAAGVMAAAAGPPKPTRVRITNWWTGAHVIEGDDAAASPAGGPTSPTWADWRGGNAKVAAAALRPAATAQLASARRRAAELRERAKARVGRHVLRRPSQPSKALVVLTSLAIAGILTTVIVAGMSWTHRSTQIASSRGAILAIPAGPSVPRLPFIDHALVRGAAGERAVAAESSRAAAAGATKPAAAPKRAILINTHLDPANARVIEHIVAETAERERSGWLVCGEDIETIAALSPLVPAWNEDRRRFDAAIEDVLEEFGYAAILWVYSTPGAGPAVERTHSMFITAERKGASKRRGPCPDSATAPPTIDDTVVEGVRGEPEACAAGVGGALAGL